VAVSSCGQSTVARRSPTEASIAPGPPVVRRDPAARRLRRRASRIRPAMGLVYSIVASLSLWIVLWALGAKALDSFLLASLLIVIAVTVQMLQKYNPSKRQR
jgi:hypothetical protein